MSAPTWSEKLDLPHRLYSDFHNCFEYIVKIHNDKKLSNNPRIRIYLNGIENRTTFEIKRGCHLEHLTCKTIKLLVSSESKIIRNKKGDHRADLEITGVVIIRFNREFYLHFLKINSLVYYQRIHIKTLYFQRPLIWSFHILKCGLMMKVLNR